jgi:site-specific DNA-methyltransferase (adenine-specific)
MSPAPIQRNTLFYGDNLTVLRDRIPDASIDLIYLDPPFNSKRTYNVLFKDESGNEADAQITAFDDAWHWGQSAEDTYEQLVQGTNPEVATMIASMRQFIGANQMMAYLIMMTARLAELHRVLKPTGSLYLHCDPTASHYLKILLDTIFGFDKFVNEIVWQRTAVKGDVRRKYGAVHDVLLMYVKNDQYVFQSVFSKPDDEYAARFRFDDNDGKGPYQSAPLDSPNLRPNLTYEYKGYPPPTKGWRVSLEVMQQLDKDGKLIFPPNKSGRIRRKVYIREQFGPKVADVWTDIPPLQATAAERMGYPTQKPLALLERIIQASSNPGDIVLDPFSGCGTAIAAAQKLDRKWVGIDITHLAIAMHKNRLKDMFELLPGHDYDVIGEPTDIADARQLARDDRYQFQWWALSLVQARPLGGGEEGKGKKGKDAGIDGVIPFVEDASGKLRKVLIQVKSGHVKSGDIRDLRGVLEREKDAPISVFITLEKPSNDMVKEALVAGSYQSPLWQQKYPRLQILTVEEILNGATVKMPPSFGAFKRAERVKKAGGIQQELEF